MSAKNLLQKIFKKNDTSVTNTHSFVKRESRVDVLPLHNVSFNLKDPPHSTPLPIANLSFGGVGILANGVRGIEGVHQKIKGSLNVAQKDIGLELRIAFHRGTSIGCEFINPSPELRKTIQSYFDLELSALEMRQINDQELAKNLGESPHWYLGENNCELYLVEKNEKLASFRLSFFGNSIEYQAGLPLKYGFAVIDPEKESAWKAGDEVVPGAIKFVSNIGTLSPQLKKEIRDIISRKN